MTRRDRLEARQQRRLNWAASREAKASSANAAADAVSQRFAGGQPILVGHHSEKRARRDQERMHASMGRAVEHQEMARHHEARADGIQRQLDDSIFNDDSDAIARLKERIEKRERQAAVLVAVRNAYRKGGAEALRGLKLPNGETLGDKLANTCAETGMAPVEAYELTNLRASIRRDRERMEKLERTK